MPLDSTVGRFVFEEIIAINFYDSLGPHAGVNFRVIFLPMFSSNQSGRGREREIVIFDLRFP